MEAAQSENGGALGIQIVRRDRWVPPALRAFNPKSALAHYVVSILHLLPLEAGEELLRRISATLVAESALFGRVRRASGRWEDLGLLGTKVVTTVGAQFICDSWRGSATIGNMKYHGIGTGNTAEASSDTALVTELTTQYNPDNTRATGSLTEGASANIFRTVGTNTVDATAAVTEHGIFSAATAGTLLDRSVFSVINLAASDSLQSTYDLTCTAGG